MNVLNTVPFGELRGTGNDFFVVDIGGPVPDRPTFARTHCNRGAGITLSESERHGADGVLFLALESHYDPPWVVMTLVQSDGSVAAICGNDAHVAAAWIAKRTGTNEVMIGTPVGTRRASLDSTDVTVEMGMPSSAPRDVPLTSNDELIGTEVEGLTVTIVNTGIPHVVAFVDNMNDVDLESVAPPVHHTSVFPKDANVTLASPDGEGGFRQRILERGVKGRTQSCSTGTIAVIAATERLGCVPSDDPVTVTPPGGALSVTVPDEGATLLGGPAVYEGGGEADIVFRKR